MPQVVQLQPQQQSFQHVAELQQPPLQEVAELQLDSGSASQADVVTDDHHGLTSQASLASIVEVAVPGAYS